MDTKICLFNATLAANATSFACLPVEDFENLAERARSNLESDHRVTPDAAIRWMQAMARSCQRAA